MIRCRPGRVLGNCSHEALSLQPSPWTQHQVYQVLQREKLKRCLPSPLAPYLPSQSALVVPYLCARIVPSWSSPQKIILEVSFFHPNVKDGSYSAIAVRLQLSCRFCTAQWKDENCDSLFQRWPEVSGTPNLWRRTIHQFWPWTASMTIRDSLVLYLAEDMVMIPKPPAIYEWKLLNPYSIDLHGITFILSDIESTVLANLDTV